MGTQGAACGHSTGFGRSPCGCASCCTNGRGGLADKGCGKVHVGPFSPRAATLGSEVGSSACPWPPAGSMLLDWESWHCMWAEQLAVRPCAWEKPHFGFHFVLAALFLYRLRCCTAVWAAPTPRAPSPPQPTRSTTLTLRHFPNHLHTLLSARGATRLLQTSQGWQEAACTRRHVGGLCSSLMGNTVWVLILYVAGVSIAQRQWNRLGAGLGCCWCWQGAALQPTPCSCCRSLVLSSVPRARANI